jgi:transposase
LGERARERGEAIDGEDSGQARHCTDAIKETLYEHRKSLFGAISVAFFDTTSLYFEGDGGATLGQLGHTKDFRAQLNQVVLGIVLDEQDRPIASFLWPGNTADVTTLCRSSSGCAAASGSSGPVSSLIAA